MQSQTAIVLVCAMGGMLVWGMSEIGETRFVEKRGCIGTEFSSEKQERRGDVTKVNRKIRMKVTAYCLCKICCGKWAESETRKTSTGDNAKVYDGVAADPKLLLYRTRLIIPGLGEKEVDDTGGGMRQSAKQGVYHIDVRMPSHSEARRFGVRWLDVEIQ